MDRIGFLLSSRTRHIASIARALAVLAFAALSACAPRIAAAGLETRMPAIEGDRFVTRDGLPLGLAHWDAGNPRAVIVALHGMNDYSNAFSMPAPWWAEHGIATYAYDQRGFGRSPNPGVWPGTEALRRDLADFVDVVRSRHPGVPVYVLGESMGGAVAITAFASESPPDAAGLILVAPAVWGWSTLPFSYRATLWMTAHAVPWWTLTGRGLNILPSDNIEMLRANGRDPLFQKATRTDAIYGLVSLMDEGLNRAAHMAPVPLLVLYGEKDQIIPRSATEKMLMGLGANATVKRYANGYHMLLRDLDGAARWADIAAWIDAQSRAGAAVAALSGAGERGKLTLSPHFALVAPES